MSLAAQIKGGIKQVHRFTGSAFPCQLLGRSFVPVHGRKTYEKKPSDAGFIGGATVVFDALNEDVAGLNHKTTFGQIVTHRGDQFIVLRCEVGELTTLFYCDAKSA